MKRLGPFSDNLILPYFHTRILIILRYIIAHTYFTYNGVISKVYGKFGARFEFAICILYRHLPNETSVIYQDLI